MFLPVAWLGTPIQGWTEVVLLGEPLAWVLASAWENVPYFPIKCDVSCGISVYQIPYFLLKSFIRLSSKSFVLWVFLKCLEEFTQWGHLDLSFLCEFLNYRYFWKIFCWCIIIKHEYCRLKNLKGCGNRKLQLLRYGENTGILRDRRGLKKGAGLCLTGCSVNDWLLWPHPELLMCWTQKCGFDSLQSEEFDQKFEVG